MRRFLVFNLIFAFLIGSPVVAFAATKQPVKPPKPTVTQQAPGQTVKKKVQQRNAERKAEIKNKVETKKEEVKKKIVNPQIQNKPKASKPSVVKPKTAGKTPKVAPKKK